MPHLGDDPPAAAEAPYRVTPHQPTGTVVPTWVINPQQLRKPLTRRLRRVKRLSKIAKNTVQPRINHSPDRFWKARVSVVGFVISLDSHGSFWKENHKSLMAARSPVSCSVQWSR